MQTAESEELTQLGRGMADHDVDSGSPGDQLKPTQGIHCLALGMDQARNITDNGLGFAGRQRSPEALR